MSSPLALHKRTIAIVSAVVLLHVGGLAALQSGLLVRAVEIVVPVEMISQIIEPPKPVEALPPPPAPRPPSPPEPVKVNKAVAPPQAAMTTPVSELSPAPSAPAVMAAAPSPLPPVASAAAIAPSAATAAPSPSLAPTAKVELPLSDADYLSNPKPPYPLASKRLGEQGRVIVRVYVGADGSAQKVELNKSSGFDRLDAAAVTTITRWRFKPGTRSGVPEAMWHLIPIDFVLDN